MKDLKYNEERIIEKMSYELSLPKNIQRKFRMFVWFYLKEGQFIYDDMFFDAEEIQSLIKKNKLVFKCIASHQGEKMVKYVLNTKQC
jgi:hypothetical protein